MGRSLDGIYSSSEVDVMNPLKRGSVRLATIVTTVGVVGCWAFMNVIEGLAYLELVKENPATDLPKLELIPIPGWAVTLVSAVLGFKQIEKHIETKNDVVFPPPE